MIVLTSPVDYHSFTGHLQCAMNRIYALDKPGKNESKNQFIETVWGAGYRFRID